MTPNRTRTLLAIHRITGLIVSANMVLFALTGGILIFHDEIDAALGVGPKIAAGEVEVTPAGAVELARAAYPDRTAVYVFRDEEEHPNALMVGMTHGAARTLAASKPVIVDVTRAVVTPEIDFDNTFSRIVWKLHAQLLMGPPGQILVGLFGLALLVSLGTGVVIYGPMMKRFAFGVLRRERHLRTLLADLHKLMGAASFGWTLVVVFTGTLLSAGTFMLQYYTMTELAALGAPYAGQTPVSNMAGLDRAAANAERASGGRSWSLIALPGSDFASPRHFSVLLKGTDGFDQRMLTMALVDATDPEAVDHRQFPWYLRALLVAEPLHFGDYGGLPLKLVWLAFTLITLLMTVSGVFVTFAARRDRAARQRSAALDAPAEGVPMGEATS